MTDHKDDDIRLETWFAAASVQRPAPSADLLARVLQDARDLQPSARPRVGPVPRRGALRQMFETLGGWPAVAGLTAATLAGVWIGISPPEPVAEATERYLASAEPLYLVDLGAEAAFPFADEAL